MLKRFLLVVSRVFKSTTAVRLFPHAPGLDAPNVRLPPSGICAAPAGVAAGTAGAGVAAAAPPAAAPAGAAGGAGGIDAASATTRTITAWLPPLRKKSL